MKLLGIRIWAGGLYPNKVATTTAIRAWESRDTLMSVSSTSAALRHTEIKPEQPMYCRLIGSQLTVLGMLGYSGMKASIHIVWLPKQVAQAHPDVS